MMKVSELKGKMLDYWVAKARKFEFYWSEHGYWMYAEPGGERYSECSGWQTWGSEHVGWRNFGSKKKSGEACAMPHPSEALREWSPTENFNDFGPVLVEMLATGFMVAQLDKEAGREAEVYCSNTDERDRPLSPKRTKRRLKQYGETVQIAVCRARVELAFGDEVDEKGNEILNRVAS